jgi:hypothetical protein
MEQCDVLVVGGGNAGCAAALAAARSGVRVMLVERYGFLGGTATASMVGPWMTFHSGRERIVGGIAQEFVERLVALGASPGHIPDSSDYVDSITPFDPEVHKALLFEMMREAGVRLLLHAYFLEAVRDEHGRVRGGRFATVAGVREILAGRAIDATADAFVAASAGVRMQEASLRGNVQPATMMFRISHVDMEELSTYVRRHPEEMRTSLKTHERTPERMTAIAGLYTLWGGACERGEITIKRELVSLFATPYPDELTVNMSRVVDIDPLDPDDLTRAEIESRAQVMELMRFFRERVPGFKNARLAATATQIGIRESRRIVGEYTLTAKDVLEARQFPDAIARSAYPIDIHNPKGAGTTTVRLPKGSAYEIPYRCLVPLDVDDLIVAGRCISTSHEAHATTRLTPTVMTLGQGAGTAAAISVKSHVPFRHLDTKLLRDQLIAAGVDLRRS